MVPPILDIWYSNDYSKIVRLINTWLFYEVNKWIDYIYLKVNINICNYTYHHISLL